jgi:acyl carrier protein
MQPIADNLRQFILTRYLPGESPGNLRDDTRLRSTGVLDSLATLALISFIESEYGIEIAAHETDIDNFDRIQDMVSFIERKRGH